MDKPTIGHTLWCVTYAIPDKFFTEAAFSSGPTRWLPVFESQADAQEWIIKQNLPNVQALPLWSVY